MYVRRDLRLTNLRGHVIKCSHFMPKETSSAPFPCVIFCHGNCGNRLDSLDAMEMLLPHGYTLFTFDFSGSGLSEGDIVSLGYYEKDDIITIV